MLFGLSVDILISAAVGGMAALAFTGSPLSAQNPEVTPTSPANSTPGATANQHHQHQEMMAQMQQTMSQMQQMMEKCKAKMSQGMTGSGNTHTGGQQGQHGQGNKNHSTGN
jgi:Tfp pilus assembly protein FimV